MMLWVHAALTLLWLGLTLYTVTHKEWRKSVPWLVFMSGYANTVGHWAAFQAALVDKGG